MRSMWIVRTIILVLSLTLAVVLIARRNVLIGLLVGALALGRAFMFVTMMKRRRAFRDRVRHRLGDRP